MNKGFFDAKVITSSAIALNILEDDMKAILSIISHETTPFYPSIGRSAWMKLDSPIQVDHVWPAKKISSVKLKGVGLFDQKGNHHLPSDRPYIRSVVHLGIDSAGQFTETVAAPAPRGGMSLQRAISEYSIASELVKFNVPCEIPLLLFEYAKPGVSDNREALASIVAGLPTDTYDRGDVIIDRLSMDLEHGATVSTVSRLSSYEEYEAMWSSYGGGLRKFHECGFHRHNANPRNFCVHGCIVYFVDLDSSKSLLEHKHDFRFLHALRDVAGAIFHMTTSLLSCEISRKLEKSEMLKILPIAKFLKSYFYDASSGDIGIADAKIKAYLSALYDNYAQHGLGERKIFTPAEDLDYQEYMLQKDFSRTLGIDRPAEFVRMIPALNFLYSRSAITKKYPQGISIYELEARKNHFLEKRG